MSESKSVVTMFLLVQLVTVVFDKFVKSVEFAPVVTMPLLLYCRRKQHTWNTFSRYQQAIVMYVAGGCFLIAI